MPASHGQLHYRIADLREKIAVQERKTKKLRSRVIRKGGRKKAPRLFKAYRRNVAELQEMRDDLARLKRQHKKRFHTPRPVRAKALDVARGLVGVMEQGGNNQGEMVMRIIRANGGTGPEPWCGDFVAYCYRLAGSKRPQRPWAAVRLLRGCAGITVTSKPKPGDLVVFDFDHVGMFEKWVDDDTIQTIEGNTGASGAVSDSRTGGDGVYRKRRELHQVAYFLRVHG